MGKDSHATAIPDEDFEAGAADPAPVRVEGRGHGRLVVVLLGLDCFDDRGVAAVGADHDLGVFCHRGAARLLASHTDDGSVLDEDVVDRERLAHLGTGVGCGVDQHRVEHGPARAVGLVDAVDRPGRPLDRERSEVEAVGPDRGTARRRQRVAQTPPLQRRHAWCVDEVGRHGVARERRPVHQQDPVAPSGEQHRRRCAAAAGPDHDGVIALGHQSLRSGPRRRRGRRTWVGRRGAASACSANSAVSGRLEFSMADS